VLDDIDVPVIVATELAQHHAPQLPPELEDVPWLEQRLVRDLGVRAVGKVDDMAASVRHRTTVGPGSSSAIRNFPRAGLTGRRLLPLMERRFGAGRPFSIGTAPLSS